MNLILILSLILNMSNIIIEDKKEIHFGVGASGV